MNAKYLEYLACLFAHGCVPCILRPARGTCSSKTFMDQTWMTNPTSVTESAIIGNLSEISDHFPVMVCCTERNLVISRGDFFIHEYRLKVEQCDANFCTFVSKLDFETYHRSENVEETYEIFSNDISNANKRTNKT